MRAIFVSGTVVVRRTVPRGGGARLEIEAGLAEIRRNEAGEAVPEGVDELLLIASFLRRPPPELHVVALDRDAVIAAVNGVALAA